MCHTAKRIERRPTGFCSVSIPHLLWYRIYERLVFSEVYSFAAQKTNVAILLLYNGGHAEKTMIIIFFMTDEKLTDLTGNDL
jgi:hypothetical protein